MATFLLKYLPGVRGKKTSLTLQESQTECEMVEKILNQIHEQHHHPIKHFLDQASPEDSNHLSNDELEDDDDDELPVSTYSDYSLVFDADGETTRSLALILTPNVATKTQEIVLAGVLPGNPPGNLAMRAIVSMSECCRPVFHMLQTVRTGVAFWTQSWIGTSSQWPRMHFRTKAFQID